MLGDRAGILGLADIGNRFALTNLPGKTLLVATEQPSTSITATHILNAIISGETIMVDRKFRDPLEIKPDGKIAWAMNEYPRVKDPGSGLFRRIKVLLIPQMDEAKRDPRIKEAVKLEGAGILNWALDGLERLRQRGHFDIPASVKSATEDYQAMNDVPATFVNQMCLIGPGYRIQSSKLYGAYNAWCLANGHRPQSSTAIAEHWRRLGFTRYMADGRVWWRGVCLRD
jgi:putative DNA primase/helicase